MEQQTNLVTRVPVTLHAELKKIAQEESKRTGLRVDLSSVVRRALMLDVEARKKLSPGVANG